MSEKEELRSCKEKRENANKISSVETNLCTMVLGQSASATDVASALSQTRHSLIKSTPSTRQTNCEPLPFFTSPSTAHVKALVNTGHTAQGTISRDFHPILYLQDSPQPSFNNYFFLG